jgi:ABC-type antimicrobial peptide transport system permease subunit
LGSWWEILTVFFLSTFKFVLGGVPLALGLGFSFFETVVVTSMGGFTGVLLFVGVSNFIIKKLKLRKLEHQKNENAATVKRKKIFTRKNRLIITVKQRFGLWGIAALTPLLFSIPIGCFLATRYFKDRQKIIVYMFASILLWSVSIASFKLLF